VPTLQTLILYALAASWTAGVSAEESTAGGAPAERPAVQAVGSSSGESGHTLKWLPYRPSKVIVDRQVVSALAVGEQGADGTPLKNGRIVRVSDEQPLKAGPPENNPFQDPFGDKLQGQAVEMAGRKHRAVRDARTGDQPGPLPAQPPADKLLRKPAPLSATPEIAPASPELAPRDRTPVGAAPPSSFPEGPKLPEAHCPNYEELDLKPIGKISSDITPQGGKFPLECPLRAETYQPRDWPVLTYTWKAAGSCNKPLYFEEPHLERYGHSLGPALQPFASAAHFFLVVPALPYFMGVYPPNECIYTLGYYRPGSCAPYLVDPFPLSVRGALFEAAAATGMPYIIP
jgi:hypothetical protein